MIFHRLTQACRMMANKGYTVLAYLDDFLIIEPTQFRCRAAFNMLVSLLESLGFTINWTKVVYPTQCLTFLGVEINIVKCELRLPDDRVAQLLSLCKETNLKRKCSKLYLQRLLGKLNWVLSEGAASFLGVLSPWQTLLNVHTIASVQTWWTSLLPAHNCKTLFPSAIPELPTPVLTDASTSGGGCVWGTD